MLYVISLIIHVIAVVIWIGGVAFVTLIVFPMLQRFNNSLEQVLMFQGIEHRFSKIAKVMIILAGLSGLLLIQIRGLSSGVWVMIAVWSVYAALIFGLERIVFDKIFSNPAGQEFDTRKVFSLLQVFHWLVLAVSLFAVAAGIWTAHY